MINRIKTCLGNNKKKLYLFVMIAITTLTVIPVLVLALYNHPSADDYNYAISTYHMWKETHSIGMLLKTAIETSVHYWQTWQGLYSSAFLLSLQPAIFGEKYYIITGYLMVGIIYICNIIFSCSILCKRCCATKMEGITFGSMFSFLMIQWIPVPVEGIYWFNGAVNYGLFFGLLLVLIAISLNIDVNSSKPKYIVKVIGLSVLAVILAGGNHVTAFMGLLFLLGISIISIAVKKKKMALGIIIAFLCMALGFCINVSSPGTAVRQARFTERPSFLGTIKLSIINALDFIKGWTGLFLIICLLLMLPSIISIVRRIIERYNFQFKFPLLVFIVSVGWICAMLCPPLYAMGMPGSGRLINVVYFSFIILVFVNVFYICGWLLNKIDAKKEEENKAEYFVKGWSATAVILVIGLSMACGKDTLSYRAFVTLRDGVAQQYSKEAYERYDILINSAGKDVVVDSYTQQPELLFFDDITEDKSDWRNKGATKYYDLKSIRK